LVNNKY
jgi:hypothetical protein